MATQSALSSLSVFFRPLPILRNLCMSDEIDPEADEITSNYSDGCGGIVLGGTGLFLLGGCLYLLSECRTPARKTSGRTPGCQGYRIRAEDTGLPPLKTRDNV